MTAGVAAQREAHVEVGLVGELLVQRGGEGEIEVVVVPGFDEIHGVATHRHSIAVGGIKAVPVNLACRLVVLQEVVGFHEVAVALVGAVVGVVHVPYIIITAREVLPIVGLGVVGIVVVQTGALVHGILAMERRGEPGRTIDVPIPCQHGAWSEVVDDTGVAHLAVLISPIGVVLPVVGYPITLVGAGAL